MVNNPFLSSRSALPPQKALQLVNLLLENARRTEDPEMALALCSDAKAALSRTKRAAKIALATSKTEEDQILCDGFARAYLEHGKLLERLRHSDEAQVSYRKAEKWGYVELHRCTKDLVPAITSAADTIGRDIAYIPEGIFPDDMRQIAVSFTLPDADERLSDTSQLAHCLGLLLATPSSHEEFEPASSKWLKATENNAEEKERLRTMGKDLIRAFTRDELRDSRAIAEVVSLASVLDKSDFGYLLRLFVNGVDQSSLLDVQSLEGLGQLIQSAPSGYLDADDLVMILDNLNTRLQDTHNQSSDHIYLLTLAVSSVLDAMADTKVSGVRRVELHEPLSAYLDGLQGSSNPYLIYQAAYAFQALQCIPDDESPWQATKRRTGIVMKDVSGLVSAAKGLDVNGFVEGLGHLQEGLGEVIQVAKMGYEGVSALFEGGQGLLNSLKVGLSFSRKRAWYAALRGADTLLRDGQLAKFKTLVCEASCRRHVAFQLGICQRLGNLAASTQCDTESREGAVAFLGEIYKNDDAWGQQALVKQCILHIFMELASTFGSALPGVEFLLKELESNGNDANGTLYQQCQREDRSLRTLKVVLPALSSPSLLDRVQNKPDVETDLRRLKKQRLWGQGDAIYIPPQAKANLQAPDDNLFDLTKYIEGFLSSKHCKVMLLLGDSGVGKSTFNRTLECDLWRRFIKKEDRIPLYINLPGIDKPEQDLIAKHLRRHDFTEPQIRELKDRREFVLICDGYDESRQIHNLYTSNQLNQEGQWRAQMVISCRSEYLAQDYRDRFQPSDPNPGAISEIFLEAVVAPFSTAQIQDYVTRYVYASRPLWRTKDYLDALGMMPDLMELVKNPFLLTLSLEVLPRMMDPGQDVSAAQITRVALYDQFVEQWLERGKKRLSEKSDLSDSARRAFERLTDEGFTQNGITFARDLAGAIYKHQNGNPVVNYSHKRDSKTWKGKFFNRDDENQLLLEACPLIRNGSQYRFVHRSLLEYCFTRVVFEPQEVKKISDQAPTLGRRRSVSSMFSFEDRDMPEEQSVDIEQPLEDHPLTWRSFVSESSILQFLAERVQHELVFKKQLLAMIERSKVDKYARKAAANAITILVRAGVPFIGADLKGIQIPGADLSGGQFDSALLQGADLRMVNLRTIWLRQADLSHARMAGMQFGEWPYLEEEGWAFSCAYSPDGKTCAVGLEDNRISVYTTLTWEKRLSLEGHLLYVVSVAFSPSGGQIASGSWDKTVRLWDVQSGVAGHVLRNHTASVNSVAFSPNGKQIASGSDDKTVRLWDAQSGAPGLVLQHTHWVTSVVYSPSGEQVASGGKDNNVRLWDVQSGAPRHTLQGHTDAVMSVAYSPSGKQIASGSWDRTVQLWDAHSGAHEHTLEGHTDSVWSLAYSPNSEQIASSSDDTTVRLWDTQSGAAGNTLQGHTDAVRSVAYSPSGKQIASGSQDNTIRLWEARKGLAHNLDGHKASIWSVAYSPDGKQIASGSQDDTVRLWDAQSGTREHCLQGHTKSVFSVAYSPDSEQIASGSADYTVRLWNVQSGASGHILEGHTGYVNSVAYSPSGKQIASGSDDTTVRLWEVQSGAPRHILEGHAEAVTSVAFSPSSEQIASGSRDETVRLWDAQSGAPGRTLYGHTWTVSSVVYSPSGKQIASGSDDTSVRLWDPQTGTSGHTLEGHNSYIFSVVYSPSGEQIASGSNDKTVRLWSPQSGQCQMVFEVCGVVRSLAWRETHESLYLGTGSEDKSVRQWQVMREGEEYKALLCWSSTHAALTTSKALIEGIEGLSLANERLFTQLGAVQARV